MATSYRNKFNESDSGGSSDSDAECDVWKRATRRPPRPADDDLPEPQSSIPSSSESCAKKRKVNTIWSDVIMEAEVSDTLGSVGLNIKPENAHDRSSETYDFTRKALDTRPYPEDELCMDSEELGESEKSKGRHHHHKKIHISKTDSSVARKICWKLGEPKKLLMGRVVATIGAKKAIELLTMTEDIEDSGGMLIKNGIRRRSPGGVFFHLLKSDKSIPKEKLDELFAEEEANYVNFIKTQKENRKKLKEQGLWKKTNKKKKSNKKNSKNMDTSPTQSTSTCSSILENQNVSEDLQNLFEEMPVDTSENKDIKDDSVIDIGLHAEDNIKSEDLNRDSDIEDGEILD